MHQNNGKVGRNLLGTYGFFTGLAMVAVARHGGLGTVETIDSIGEKCNSYQNLFIILGAIWANVLGMEKGLLSTGQQLDFLEWNGQWLLTGKKLGIKMGIGTMQPRVAPCL